MSRVPYVYPATGTSEIGDKIRKRRGGGLNPLDGVFLNAPEVAGGYNEFIGAVRGRMSLPDDLREALALRVMALNKGAFEWKIHLPLARQAGITTAQLRAIHDTSKISKATENKDYTPLLAAAMDFCDASTCSIKVPQDVFDRLKSHMNDQQVVEVTATVGAFNMISRFIVALNVDNVADEEIPVPE
ncbi:hypothetical protein K439DRAFT_1660771 [Ramaria rubella]|nr:hypothetical protein K439DRAFT_1660771 [Ramaria rubella]